MRPSTFLLVVLVLTLTLTLPAISAGPAAHSVPAQQTSQPPAVPTIQVYSRETIVDIIVTDPKGQPVRSLSKSDFTINEDGKPQPIRSFGEFDAETTAPAPDSPTLPSGIRTNYAAAPASGPVNIILIDALHSDWISVAHALQATGAYAARMPRGTELAVFWLSVSGTATPPTALPSTPSTGSPPTSPASRAAKTSFGLPPVCPFTSSATEATAGAPKPPAAKSIHRISSEPAAPTASPCSPALEEPNRASI
jgi:hypothetical protein